jgi:hypothetical protein
LCQRIRLSSFIEAILVYIVSEHRQLKGALLL